MAEAVTLHIGIASWQNPGALAQSIECIRRNTSGDWKLLIVDNGSPDGRVVEVINQAMSDDGRIIADFRSSNVGYVGAVNQILMWAEEERAHHVAYVDNDAFVRTASWNDALAGVLNRHHEVAMAFPKKFSSYVMPGAGYDECLWGLGCCWLLSVARYREIGGFDDTLGHQEEADYALRMHLAGWKLAAVDIDVDHQANATRNPEAQERINAGVIRWVDKWCRYFAGPHVNYYSSNVIRWEDWPPVALYLERYWQALQAQGKMPLLNRDPEQVVIEGQTYDLIAKPRYPHLYRDRLA